MNDRERREGELVRARAVELYESPIDGRFDVKHLRAVHNYLFQDLPEYRPGVIRERTKKAWVKHRILEGHATGYVVRYASEQIEAKLTRALREFGGAGAIEGLPPGSAAAKLAGLYGDLDYAHGFSEGNSRTLREFTRELAQAGGYRLDWVGRGVGAAERNALYLARDLAVLERAWPRLTPERAMATDDRAEYEASFVLERLRLAVGARTLEAIILAGLTPTGS